MKAEEEHVRQPIHARGHRHNSDVCDDCQQSKSNDPERSTVGSMEPSAKPASGKNRAHDRRTHGRKEEHFEEVCQRVQ